MILPGGQVLRPFPRGFRWGTATAGHQNEGDNVDSDTWFLENVTPTVFGALRQGRERLRAVGSDLDLVAGMGLNAYRFSVEWARIEPVEGEFSEEALAHYEAIVDGCLARGLAPIVTFNHFTSPHWFAARGAWLDPEAPLCSLATRRRDGPLRRPASRSRSRSTSPTSPRCSRWAHLPESSSSSARRSPRPLRAGRA